MDTFLQRHRGMSEKESGLYVGLSAVVGGLLGTLGGGVFADYLKRWTRLPYWALSGWTMVLATVFGTLALSLPDANQAVAMLFLAEFFLWCHNGPINPILTNCVSSALRVRSFALTILVIHLLGDAVSPSIVGFASDFVGLERAIQLVPLAMSVGALIWLYSWRTTAERAA